MADSIPSAQHSPVETESKETERDAVTNSRAREGRSRIAQAGQKIRAEATRALGKEAPPRRRAPARKEPPVPEHPFLRGLGLQERATLVELADSGGAPLMCMPPEQALRQGLHPEVVAVALRTRQNNIVACRRKNPRLGFAGRWDVYCGFVQVGESGEDSAIRLLAEDAGLGALAPIEAARWKHAEGNGSGLCFGLTLFIAELPSGLYPALAAQDRMELDQDELRGLIEQVPDLLTPELLWAAKTGKLFR